MGGGGKGGGKQTIGYQYFLGLHMIICHGPVDSIGPVYAGERVITITNPSYSGAPGTSIVHGSANSPNLFGGKKKEGGIQGRVDFMFGADDQGQNSYLAARLGADNLPSFRGVVSVVCRKIYIAAMNPYPKPWWFTIKNIPQKDWYSAKADINSGSANGAHILRESITNADWGLGYPFTMIDDPSFRQVADTLHSEGFGLSMMLAGQGSVEDFMQQVLRHINGVVFSDRVTGRFILRLIRDDYDVATLPAFDENNILSLDSFQRPTFAEMVNEVVIVYRRRGEYKDSALTFQDLASVQAQGGVISQRIQFPGIDNPNIAARVGIRELRQQSTPLAQVRMTVNRDGWNINPGDPIKMSWPALGIENIVLRVIKANYGDVLRGRITFEAVEDVFGLPASSYVEPQDPIWTDPVLDPVPLATRRIEELTYWDIAIGSVPGGASYVDTLDETTTLMVMMGVEPSSPGPSFQLWSRFDNVSPVPPFQLMATGPYAPESLLDQDMGYTDGADIQLLDVPFAADEIEIGTYVYIDEEIMRLDALDADNLTISVSRGGIDTVPARHKSGTRVWFAQDDWALDTTEYEEGDEIEVRALSQTGAGTLDLDFPGIPTDEYEMIGRQGKPYRPQDVQVSIAFGTSFQRYPDRVKGPAATRFQNSNRTQQTTPVVPVFNDGNTTPEAGVTYTVSFFSERNLGQPDTNADRQFTGLTGASNITQQWTDETTDSETRTHEPDPDTDLFMPLAVDAEIGGTLSGQTAPDAIVNVTFSDGRAVFAGDGYIDIDDFSLGLNWSIEFKFNPDDEGDDYQFLFGKHQQAATGGRDIFGIYWRRSDRLMYRAVNTDNRTAMADTYIEPGIEQTVMITKSSTTVRLYVGGELKHTFFASISNYIGRPWVIGADWDSGESTRRRFFTGKLRELRIYNNTVQGVTDMWSDDFRLNGHFKIEVKSIRSTVESYQKYSYIPLRIGWGLNHNLGWNGGT